MKQLSALGARRHAFFRSPRRMRPLGGRLDDSEMLGSTPYTYYGGEGPAAGALSRPPPLQPIFGFPFVPLPVFSFLRLPPCSGPEGTVRGQCPRLSQHPGPPHSHRSICIHTPTRVRAPGATLPANTPTRVYP